MTHQRTRFAETEIAKKLSYSPCVGLMGMRQVGKSTLLKQFAKAYHTFDEQSFLLQFQADPQSFLETPQLPLALDEVQKSPMAFDAIKFAVDKKKTPGRFLMSGSVRFASRKQIRESLTGRIALIELLPFTLAECHQKPISTLIDKIATHKIDEVLNSRKRKYWATYSEMTKYLESGGLPGICFRRDATIRAEMFEDHLETLLTRDIHLIRRVELPYPKLRHVLAEIAALDGRDLNMSELAQLVGSSVPTIKNLLQAFEGLFLIRPYGKTYFIQDCGLSYYLSPKQPALDRAGINRLVFHELVAQINYTHRLGIKISPLRTRGGMDVPFLIEYQSGKKLAIFIEEADRATHKVLNSFAALKKKHADVEGILFYQSDVWHKTDKGLHCIPLPALF